MARRTPIPSRPDSAARKAGPPGILELERFSQANLTRWRALSQDLDELQAVLYFGVQPEQRRLQAEIVDAIGATPAVIHEFKRWCRIVSYQYSLEPLSAAGSLTEYGGRFNPGVDLDPGTLDPWPALYLAEDPATAFREKFQLPADETVMGLTPEELALTSHASYTLVALNGTTRRTFDFTNSDPLKAVAKVLRRIKMPTRARDLGKHLGMGRAQLWMVTEGKHLHDAALQHNWRTLPVQFGLPAPSHTLAQWIRAAGFDAILYPSTKGAGRCLAVFPDKLSSGSWVELADNPPAPVKHRRLDVDSADALSAWGSLPATRRPR